MCPAGLPPHAPCRTWRDGAINWLNDHPPDLVLVSNSRGYTIVDTNGLRVRKTVTLQGNYAYDALSPKAGMLFLVKYSGDDVSRYVVKALNLRTGKLLSARIADKTQNNWIMQGLAVTRISSAAGSSAPPPRSAPAAPRAGVPCAP